MLDRRILEEVIRRLQNVVMLAILAIFIAQPALACLAPQQMSPSEMACCKQMAGDCDMANTGSGADHSCCKDVVHANAADVAPAYRGTLASPDSLCNNIQVAIAAIPQAAVIAGLRHGSPPPTSPPGMHFILRV
ncbi:MAG: hypothetical protein ABI383_10235 [Acidobacteriaceae bacterium]